MQNARAMAALLGGPDSATFALFVVCGSAQYAWMVCTSAVQLNLSLRLRSLWEKNLTLSRRVDPAGKLSSIPSRSCLYILMFVLPVSVACRFRLIRTLVPLVALLPRPSSP